MKKMRFKDFCGMFLIDTTRISRLILTDGYPFDYSEITFDETWALLNKKNLRKYKDWYVRQVLSDGRGLCFILLNNKGKEWGF